MLFKRFTDCFNNFKSISTFNFATAISPKWREQFKHKQLISQISSILLQRKSWVSILKKLKLSSELSPDFVVQILRKTQNYPEISLDFFNWAKTQFGFTHDLYSHCTMIHILIRSGLLDAARPLTNQISEPVSIVLGTMIEICGGYRDSSSLVISFLLENYSNKGSIFECLEIFQKMKINGYLPSIRCCNSLLDSLHRENAINLAWQIYAAMLRMNIEPDAATFSILTHLLCKEGKVEKAAKLLKNMEEIPFSYTPNVVLYNLVIYYYCKYGNFLLAFDLLEDMPRKNLIPNFTTYSSILDGSCKFRNFEVVNRVLSIMLAKKLLPIIGNECPAIDLGELKDVEYRTMTIPFLNYNLLIQKLCKLGMLSALELFFERALRENIDLEDTSFLAVLKALCKDGRDKESLKAYNSMLQRGISLNADDYNLLINALCKGEPLEEVNKVFGDMIQRGFSPDSSNLSKLITARCSKGRWQEADDILRLVLDNGFLPDSLSCCSLVEHYCANGHLDSVICLHNRMQKLEQTLDITSYSLIISELCVKQRSDEAIGVFDYMRRKNLLSTMSFTTLISGLCHEKKLREAMELHDEMMKKGFKPDEVTYKHIISGFM